MQEPIDGVVEFGDVGDTDADTAAEFAIQLSGVSALSAADFVL